MTHAQLVEKAVEWLRAYRCGVILSEQACVSGEMPDAIGWKRACHSVLIECKISRADFLADCDKPFRYKSELGLGCERFYLTPPGLLQGRELPPGWGLLEVRKRMVEIVRRSARDLRSAAGLSYEMNLLLASLLRVEIRIEPQTITEFLKWKNRMLQYNGGEWPTGMEPTQEERNYFLGTDVLEPHPDETSARHVPGPAEDVSPSARRDGRMCPARGRKELSHVVPAGLISGSESLKSAVRRQKKTGLVGPVSRASVEMRLHHSAARADDKVLRSV